MRMQDVAYDGETIRVDHDLAEAAKLLTGIAEDVRVAHRLGLLAIPGNPIVSGVDRESGQAVLDRMVARVALMQDERRCELIARRAGAMMGALDVLADNSSPEVAAQHARRRRWIAEFRGLWSGHAVAGRIGEIADEIRTAVG